MVSDIELELDWIDRMQRAINPLPDRLAFFWHRHWAISRDDGIDYPWVINYRNRLLKYADFGTTPDADVPGPRLRDDHAGLGDVACT